MALNYGRRWQGAAMLAAGVAALAVTITQQKQQRAQEAADAARNAAELKAQVAQAQGVSDQTLVIALWTGKPVPGEPLGVHVADVSVDTAGAVSLLISDNAQTKAAVEAAIADARAQPALEVPVSSMAAPGTPGASARPGDKDYGQAVAQFLSAKTGFKPQLQK